MNQQEHEQTVMQELQEKEQYPEFMSKEWFKQFEKNHDELSRVMEAINE